MNEIRGFTPAIDFITEEYGGTISLIYGSMWRFAQMSAMNICTASQEKIGKRAGVSRESVNKNIPTMIEANLIRETGKGQGGTIAYAPLVDISSIFTMGVNLVHSDSEETSQPPVAEVHTKKDIKKDIKISMEEGLKLGATIQSDFRKWLGLTPNWDTKTNQANYQFFRDRYQAGETAQKFKEWWVANDWRGKQGQQPTFNQVREMWLQAFINAEVDHTKYRKGD